MPVKPLVHIFVENKLFSKKYKLILAFIIHQQCVSKTGRLQILISGTCSFDIILRSCLLSHILEQQIFSRF